MSIDSTSSSNPYGAWWTSPDGIEGKQRAFSEALGSSSEIENNANQQRKDLKEASQ